MDHSSQLGVRAPTKSYDIDDRLQLQEAMKQYGGHFVKALATAWERADYKNRSIIENNFRHLIDHYYAFITRK